MTSGNRGVCSFDEAVRTSISEKRSFGSCNFKPRANGRNIVECYMLLPFAHPVACCWMLLSVVAQGLKPLKLFSVNNSQHFFCSVIAEA